MVAYLIARVEVTNPDAYEGYKKLAAAAIETRYYAPAVHTGAFALPPFITALMAGDGHTKP